MRTFAIRGFGRMRRGARRFAEKAEKQQQEGPKVDQLARFDGKTAGQTFKEMSGWERLQLLGHAVYLTGATCLSGYMIFNMGGNILGSMFHKNPYSEAVDQLQKHQAATLLLGDAFQCGKARVRDQWTDELGRKHQIFVFKAFGKRGSARVETHWVTEVDGDVECRQTVLSTRGRRVMIYKARPSFRPKASSSASAPVSSYSSPEDSSESEMKFGTEMAPMDNQLSSSSFTDDEDEMTITR
ncbi:MAG: hypothetical protein MHM6MM_007498 [Cercozoa sp. M6MM]